ncbi:MAG: DUF1799 domain-containing protein [Jannaschia sp.]
MAVGRAWARGGNTGRSDGAEEDARLMGIDLPEAMLDPEPRLWPWQMEAVACFLCVSTQWFAVAGLSGTVPMGLDYARAKAGLDLAGRTVTPDLWEDVQTIERGALKEFAK